MAMPITDLRHNRNICSGPASNLNKNNAIQICSLSSQRYKRATYYDKEQILERLKWTRSVWEHNFTFVIQIGYAMCYLRGGRFYDQLLYIHVDSMFTNACILWVSFNWLFTVAATFSVQMVFLRYKNAAELWVKWHRMSLISLTKYIVEIIYSWMQAY